MSTTTTQTPEIPRPILVNSREAARMLGISERKLFSLKTSGEIPCVQVGRSVRFRLTTLEEWAERAETT
ncbi:MAG: helix-turn-helix domain-containing protein [Planctomycetes bacterium]|nr:helix-turn-helix domain-containing protein [Planctomycetota bacterium]